MKWSKQIANGVLFTGLLVGWWLVFVCFQTVYADSLDLVRKVEFQPLASATRRLIEALDYLGAPLLKEDQAKINDALSANDHQQVVSNIQKVPDQYPDRLDRPER